MSFFLNQLMCRMNTEIMLNDPLIYSREILQGSKMSTLANKERSMLTVHLPCNFPDADIPIR